VEKKIAILVRERQVEALRMSLGLILADDVVDVYVLDRKLQQTEEGAMHMDTMLEMEMKFYTNCRENTEMEYLATAEIARRLPQYDNIVPY
jgi:hypothetical protein